MALRRRKRGAQVNVLVSQVPQGVVCSEAFTRKPGESGGEGDENRNGKGRVMNETWW